MHHFKVPVITVFTKYDQFKYNVELDILDNPDKYPDSSVSEVAKQRFQEHYLRPLGDDIRYVQLESGFRLKCQGYIPTFLRQICTCQIVAAASLLRRRLQH